MRARVKSAAAMPGTESSLRPWGICNVHLAGHAFVGRRTSRAGLSFDGNSGPDQSSSSQGMSLSDQSLKRSSTSGSSRYGVGDMHISRAISLALRAGDVGGVSNEGEERVEVVSRVRPGVAGHERSEKVSEDADEMGRRT